MAVPTIASLTFALVLCVGTSLSQDPDQQVPQRGGPPEGRQGWPPGWPQGSGPRGDWSTGGALPPVHFSVRTGENIRWRCPLPETGQGGIAVIETAAGERAFVTTMAPWDSDREEPALSEADAQRFAHAIEKRSVVGKHIDAHCIDTASGEILWTRRIEGEVPSIYTYPFSDATSASPVTDGIHVWFTNSGGQVACFTVDGEAVWQRVFTPTFDGPFNKQFEPFLVRDGDRSVLVHMEPFAAPGRDPTATEDLTGRWHYLVGLDGQTGELLWRSKDALTHYNAPTLVATASGPCVLHARGGPHEVPERPVGITLTRATGPEAGQAVWGYEDPRGNHEGSLQTMAHDERHAYWLLKDPRNLLVVLDRRTGEPLREISLTRGVTVTERNLAADAWVTRKGIDLEKGVFPARYSMIAASGQVFFQCYATAWGKPTIGPPYSFARVDPSAGGFASYLEVPTDVVRGDTRAADTWVWRTPGVSRPVNSRGIEVTGDDRCRWDGWDWVFNGSPTRVGERLYFSLACGVVYVLDSNARNGDGAWDGSALLAVNDLGPQGGTWTANSVSCAAGRLYHRTGEALYCIGGRD